jgi:hypothetical protein
VILSRVRDDRAAGPDAAFAGDVRDPKASDVTIV